VTTAAKNVSLQGVAHPSPTHHCNIHSPDLLNNKIMRHEEPFSGSRRNESDDPIPSIYTSIFKPFLPLVLTTTRLEQRET